MRKTSFVRATLVALHAPGNVQAELITVFYDATAAKVVGTPFGVTVPRTTPVTGFFQFETATADEDLADTTESVYRHLGTSAFTADFLGH